MRAVWGSRISPTSLKLTALCLADMCNDEGGSLHPSMSTIAARVGVSRSQAQRLVHTLMDAGLLSVLANADGGRPGMTPRYHLHLDRLQPEKTGSTDATGRIDATGSADAAEGSHGRTGGVAPMRQTGSTGATQSLKNHQRTIKEPKGERAAPKRRIPADWKPDDKLLQWATAKRPELDLTAVAESFRDHYLAKGEARASWDASFRQWVGREGTFGRAAGRNAQEQLEAGNRAVGKRFLSRNFDDMNYREGVGPGGELLP